MAENNEDNNAVQLAQQVTQAIGDVCAAAPEDGTKKAKKIAVAAKTGKNLCLYTIFGKCGASLKALLNLAGIPFVPLVDRKTLIIRAADYEKVKEKNKRALNEQIKYSQDVALQLLQELLNSDPAKPQRPMLTINNLSQYEVEILRNNCDGIRTGFMLGVHENEDGMYTASVDAENGETRAFLRAYLRTIMSVTGPAGYETVNAVMRNARIRDAEEQIMSSNRTVYVNSKTEKGTYLAANRRECTYYKAGQEPVRFEGEPEDVQDIVDAYMMEMFDVEPVAEQDAGKQQMVETPAPPDAPLLMAAALSEAKAANMIDKIIFAEIDAKGIKFDDVHDKFDYYTSKAVSIVTEAVKDKTALFPQEAMNVLKKIMTTPYSSPKSYQFVPDMMNDHEFVLEKPWSERTELTPSMALTQEVEKT